jgi:hypothetical protein
MLITNKEIVYEYWQQYHIGKMEKANVTTRQN